MSLNIKNKRSAVRDSAPTAEQLQDGEIGINYNAQSPALYIKDSAGAIVKLAGDSSVGNYWELDGSNLKPDSEAYNVVIGDGDITLSADGNVALTGKGTSDSTVAGDDDATLTTKDYVDAAVAGAAGATDLGLDNRNADTLDVTSSTGTDVTIPAATETLSGLMTAGDKALLDSLPQDVGVTSIIAGAGISVDQATGDVTITNTGGGGGGASVDVADTPPDPATGSEGDLFWSSSATNLYVLYQDSDGPQWVEASPGGGGGGAGDSFWSRTGTTLSPANAGDDLDNIGAITAADVELLASDSTAKGADILKLKNEAPASSKTSIDFQTYIPAFGGVTASAAKISCYSEYTGTTGASNLIFSTTTSNSNVSPTEKARITSSGDVLIGPLPSAPNISLNADGSITAAGGITNITDIGVVDVGTDPGSGNSTDVGCLISPFGLLKAQRQGADNVFEGYDNRYSTPQSTITAEGSATFAGSISTAGDITVGANPGDGSGSQGSYINAAGQFSAATASGFDVFVGRKAGSADVTSSISSSGAATFAGPCTVTRTAENSTLFEGLTNGVQKFYVQANGNGRFAGTVTENATRSGSIEILLEQDNPDNYVSTTNADGETESVYNGPVLSVLDELLDLRKRATQQDAVIAQLVTALRSQGVTIDTTDIQEAN